jgi:hypothetical protein
MIQLPISVSPAKQQISAARKLIADPDVHGAAMMACARILLGPSYHVYEFDTIRKALMDQDISVPQPNFDRLWAALTLISSTAFFWDARVFSATVRAFAGEDVEPEILEPIPPVFLGWGIREADEIMKAHLERGEGWSGEFIDGEPLEMVVASLHDAGFIQAPKGCEWVQPYLDEATGPSTLRPIIERRWGQLDKDNLADTEFKEDAVGIQLARLAGCAIYYDEREASLRKQLATLLSGS